MLIKLFSLIELFFRNVNYMLYHLDSVSSPSAIKTIEQPYYKHIWFFGRNNQWSCHSWRILLTFWNKIFSYWYSRFRKNNTSHIRRMIGDLKWDLSSQLNTSTQYTQWLQLFFSYYALILQKNTRITACFSQCLGKRQG